MFQYVSAEDDNKDLKEQSNGINIAQKCLIRLKITI